MTDNYKAPWPKSEEEVLAEIRKAIEGGKNYSTAADSMWKAALAAFNYVAHTVGATGFMASHAELMFLMKSRGIKSPFAIITADDMLFPQYNIREKVDGYLKEWGHWAGDEARKKMADHEKSKVAPRVWQRWEELATEYPEKKDNNEE